MPFKPLSLGAGANLDIDDTSAGDGQGVNCVNFYLDRAGSFRTIPGLTVYADLGTGEKVWSYDSPLFNVLVIVSGGMVWTQQESGGALTLMVGIELDASAKPTFTEDKNSIFFAANSAIHRLNPTANTVTVLGPLTPQSVTSLAYIGGYLMAAGQTGGGGSVPGDTHYSDDVANDYATWEVYNNESKPDALQAMIVAYEQVYNIGVKSLEVAYIDGTVPFSVNKNAAQHFGTPSPGSVIFDGESIYYLSEVTSARKIIKIAGGGAPQIISFPVDVPLEEFDRVDDANGFIMAFRGQNFYCLDFPTANVTIDGQFWPSVTLAYHIQKSTWLIFAQWNAIQAQFMSYRGNSFCYAERWNLRLVGGRDGILYQLAENSTVDYTVEPVLQHKWRNDNGNWGHPRNISLGLPGITNPPADQTQCGQYRSRQHRLSYTDLSDAGDVFRAEIKSGHITHGRDATKRSNFYRYSVKRGSNELVINGISEDFDYLRR
jgi:hypothetical protein